MIDQFARHPVAANLLMIMMILAGIWAATNISTSLDPKIAFPAVEVQFNWPGASAEDIEQLVTRPAELTLRTTAHLLETRSTSTPGHARLDIEFSHDADMTEALDQVKQRIANIRNLPPDIDPVNINRVQDIEPVGSVIVTGGSSIRELIPIVRDMEHELLKRGIDQIYFEGLPEEEIAIQVSSRRLRETQLSLEQLAANIAGVSANVPAGTVGRSQGQRQLRSQGQQREPAGFAALYVRAGDRLLRLGDIADIERRERDDQVNVISNGKPAIEMTLIRHTETDAIRAAAIMRKWEQDTRRQLPAGIELVIYKEAGKLLSDQLNLVFANALQSMVMVLLVLALFLNLRVAGWIAAGMPVAVLLGLAMYYFVFGGSINILALLAFIMVLGIVVDDAIVVAEESVTLYQQGASASEAVVQGARRMFAPVLASSLTTLAAFVPLLIIGGVMGDIVITLPQVLFCVIVASLVECFLILPAHLQQSFSRTRREPEGTGAKAPSGAISAPPSPLLTAHTPSSSSNTRQRLDTAFEHFRTRRFAPLLRRALDYPGATFALATATLMLTFALVAAQRVGLNLVTGIDLESLSANIQFSASATDAQKNAFINTLEHALSDADTASGGGQITGHVTHLQTARFEDQRQQGGEFAALEAMYAFAETRTLSPADFLQDWRSRFQQPPTVERLEMKVEGGSNNGEPSISLVLRGHDVATLKNAAAELSSVLARYPGVTNVRDDLPYGKGQLVFALNTNGQAMGLTSESLGRQLRAAFSGRRVQIFNDEETELEVRVVLPDAERDSMSALQQFPVQTPTGALVPLDTVADLVPRHGIDTIRHSRGEQAVRVHADVDTAKGNAHAITEHVTTDVLPGLATRHGISFGLSGSAEQDALLLRTLGAGAVLTLLFIYLILVWTLSSYIWPLAIMVTIPFGLSGAIVGHWLLGMDVGAMSLLAFFALTGIVVNDAIVLVCAFREEITKGVSARAAAELAAVSRLRAVLLTTLTTIAGLATLIFQTSSLSIYIQPIAVTICFGLGWATFLVLFVVPALLVLIDAARQRIAQTLQFINPRRRKVST